MSSIRNSSAARFVSTLSWGQDWEKARCNEGLLDIEFQENFNITDEHIDTITNSSTAANLRKLQFGDSDTGKGRFVSDQAIVRLAKACHNLEEVEFVSATSLTDIALLAIAQNCPMIKSINISGNDKIHGGVKGHCFDQLAANKDIAPVLTTVLLMDQDVRRKQIKLLTKQRPGLTVREGETVGDGIADQMVASLTCGGNVTEWRNGKMVSMSSDFGMGDISFDEFDDIDGLSFDSSDFDSEEDYDEEFGEEEEDDYEDNDEKKKIK
ncbi:hypothetical protein HI914_01295 [Erysiphe necator]|uniref:Uncharacterized protein n=1 Tax=Uncinula necator TaxID=52586 RepID=A0A0B1P1D5_UNCNE|nr:hypothetical protein HI914_01295 [Erysiphe necator]KHJ30721.1 hypothetical protein EV44_g6020 [Erysiphe necator]